MVKKKKEKKRFSLEEQVEWLAIAFVLALTVKCFVVEAYQIPTGSMAPTLYGKHYTVTCPSCHASFNLRRDEGIPPNLSFACPICGENLSGESGRRSQGYYGGVGPTRIVPRGGDRILVAKGIYHFVKPKRWDIFVFKSPERGNEEMNFVKRVVALPGEKVQLRNGQLFINDRIARKPVRVQKELWHDVYNGVNRRAAEEYWSPNGSWEVTKEGLLMSQPGAVLQTIQFNQPIVDSYPYNGVQQVNLVSDILAAGRVVMDEATGEFAAGIWADSDTWKAVFRPAGSRIVVELRENERVLADARVAAASLKDFTFSLSRLDGMVSVDVNGVGIISADLHPTPESTPLYTSGCGVFFQGAGTRLLVRDINVKRDVYYSIAPGRADESARRPFAATIPDACYFGLGDNSPISRDAREWGVIPQANVLGKAFFVFWPLTRLGPVY